MKDRKLDTFVKNKLWITTTEFAKRFVQIGELGELRDNH
jgi:hypothetical protein